MKLKILIISLFAFMFINGQAQKYITKTGYVYFMSHTDAIDIDGSNNKVAAILDVSNGEMVAIVLIKAFELPLATADKHFNETYMESDDHPKATFIGKLPEVTGLDLTVEGEHEVTAQGTLSIHGKSQEINQKVKLLVKEGKLMGNCDFKVNIDDYGITVPEDVKDRVAKVVDVKIKMTLEPMKNK
ncbi:MAG: YceI family protein [Prolixibacteraceae bacterium]|nr:YceI family protein [Prolixibacteraceae bacterium]